MQGMIAGSAGKGVLPIMALLCGCAVLPLIISCTYMGLYWNLYTIAVDFDDAYAPDGLDGIFDTCFITDWDTGIMADTKWSVAFMLNAVCYTLLTVWTCCLVLSSVAWPLAFCGACGMGCTQLFHLACVIIAGVFRYSSEG